MAGPELTLIAPAYNEAPNIRPLYEAVLKVLEPAGISFELLFIDDGSRDGTDAEIALLVAADPRVRYARFSRNFGHEAASSCGFRLARGQAVVLIDADLQDPPEVILELHQRWREGYEVVHARRRQRHGETWLKRASAYLFYRGFNRMVERAIPADVGDFRLVDRRVVDHFNALPERNRFVRGMFSWLGFRQTVVEFDRQRRQRGVTKYNYSKLLWLSLDALTSFSAAPLRACMAFGLAITLFSFLIAGTIIFQRLFFDLAVPGYALATSGIFLLGGIQLIFLGVIGEYIGKIYTQVQGRPLYIVAGSSDDLPPAPTKETADPSPESHPPGRS
ncbi:glycosyltransferase family 2 protein [Motiliproteus sediminis]|uniref:glycosyltransferase family 2 protein n=1 Tax=Motiliproteus sediminis TaxID=1468178 RepID=UPI001AF00EA7|nr:glycosyltransferase family 2 protein [Motiliproteus sediminis]